MSTVVCVCVYNIRCTWHCTNTHRPSTETVVSVWLTATREHLTLVLNVCVCAYTREMGSGDVRLCEPSGEWVSEGIDAADRPGERVLLSHSHLYVCLSVNWVWHCAAESASVVCVRALRSVSENSSQTAFSVLIIFLYAAPGVVGKNQSDRQCVCLLAVRTTNDLYKLLPTYVDAHRHSND